jgi:isopenicillin N synthase-like dioxygenase
MTTPIHRVDFSRLLRGEQRTELINACTQNGFFYLENHGLDEALHRQVMDLGKQFFASASANKEGIRRSYDNPFGYYDKELTKNRHDQKEIFDFTHPAGVDGSPFGGINQWPSEPAEFRDTMERYFRFCTKLSAALLESIADALELPSVTLADAHSAHSSFARLNYYPVVPAETDLLGIHPHSDAGSLTVLLQDDNPGLDMLLGGEWVSVPPAGEALVINMGDMLTVWSNDRIHAPIHRVRPSTEVPRISLPYFYNPSYRAVVEPLTEGPAHYKPFTWAEFRRKRAEGDFSDYGSEVQISDYRLS